jgi:hypothetical protein
MKCGWCKKTGLYLVPGTRDYVGMSVLETHHPPKTTNMICDGINTFKTLSGYRRQKGDEIFDA